MTFPALSVSSRIWHFSAFEDLMPLSLPLSFPHWSPTSSHPLLLFMGREKHSGDKTAAPGRHPDPAAGRPAIKFKGSPSTIRPCPLKRLTHDFQLRDDVNQMWSLQTAARDRAQHGRGLEVAPGRAEMGTPWGLGWPGAFLPCVCFGGGITGCLSSWGEPGRGGRAGLVAGPGPKL